MKLIVKHVYKLLLNFYNVDANFVQDENLEFENEEVFLKCSIK